MNLITPALTAVALTAVPPVEFPVSAPPPSQPIQITSDSIHFFEALGEYNQMIKTESIDYTHVLEVTDSSLTIQQPDQICTYLLFDLENHYD